MRLCKIVVGAATGKVKDNKVPLKLAINWDETKWSKFVWTSQWTLSEEGAQCRQVGVIRVEDKQETIIILAISLAGKLLPPQTLYTGKSTYCGRFPNSLGCMAFPKSLEHRRDYDSLNWGSHCSICSSSSDEGALSENQSPLKQSLMFLLHAIVCLY